MGRPWTWGPHMTSSDPLPEPSLSPEEDMVLSENDWKGQDFDTSFLLPTLGSS